MNNLEALSLFFFLHFIFSLNVCEPIQRRYQDTHEKFYRHENEERITKIPTATDTVTSTNEQQLNQCEWMIFNVHNAKQMCDCKRWIWHVWWIYFQCFDAWKYLLRYILLVIVVGKTHEMVRWISFVCGLGPFYLFIYFIFIDWFFFVFFLFSVCAMIFLCFSVARHSPPQKRFTIIDTRFAVTSHALLI